METFLFASNVALWVVVILQCVFLFLMARTVGQFLNRFQLSSKSVVRRKLQPGGRAPLFREVDHREQTLRLVDFQGRHVLLLFVDDRCPACKRALDVLPELRGKYPQVPVLVISSSVKEMDLESVPDGVHVIHAPEVVDNYFVEKTPTAVLVDPYGLLAEMAEVREPAQLLGMLDVQVRKVG